MTTFNHWLVRLKRPCAVMLELVIPRYGVTRSDYTGEPGRREAERRALAVAPAGYVVSSTERVDVNH